MMRALSLSALGAACCLLAACAGSLPSLSPGDAALTQADEAEITGALPAADGVPPLPERRGKDAAAVAQAPSPRTNFMGHLASLLPAGIDSGAAAASETAHADADPTTVYARIAQRVKSCWLNRANPVIPGHKFHAEASPSGEASITLYKKVDGAALGVAAFRIKIMRDGSGTSVHSENVKLPEALKPALLTDVTAWAQGREGCAARSAAVAGKTATP